MNTKIRITVLIFGLFCFQNSFGQSHLEPFLKPSDSLNISRRNSLALAEASTLTIGLVGLNQLWYAYYPHSNFHLINDNSEWLQMDKLGHLYTCYNLGSFGANALKWSGATQKSQLVYGATIGLAFMTTIEVFDGYSSEWGFSIGDMVANISGTGLYVSQELLWKEQRIVPKFSFHTTSYAAVRPNQLGSTFNEQIIKDYNGQTYWYSINLYSFLKNNKIPKWLNVAIGYGAEGMVSGNEHFYDPNIAFYPKRYRQFYLSLDADLTKIKTKSHFLKTFFFVFNTIKIPAPTIELGANKAFHFYGLYF